MLTFNSKYKLFIDGTFRDAEGGRTISVYNPADGE